MTSDNQGALASKSAVRNWSDEEKDVVWEQALKAKNENLPLTEAFRRSAKLLPHRSEAACGMLYYNVLRKEREEPSLPAKKSPTSRVSQEFSVDPRLLEAFQGLPEYMQELAEKIEGLEERLLEPDPLTILKALAQLVKSHHSQSGELELIQTLKDENQDLQRANKKLEEDLKTLREAYDDALGIYDMFTNMASISQIMSLGDFKQQMKTTLDKWGNVLDITFARNL